jgi:hypothetical protein
VSGNETSTIVSGNDKNIDLKSTGQKPSLAKTTDGLLTPKSMKQSSETDVLKLAKIYVEYLWNEGWKNEVIELVKEAVSFIYF